MNGPVVNAKSDFPWLHLKEGLTLDLHPRIRVLVNALRFVRIE